MLIAREEAIQLMPSLKDETPEYMEAAIQRASIYVISRINGNVGNEIPSDIKLAICILVDIEKDGVEKVKEISRTDYKEVYDTNDYRWKLLEDILSKYSKKENKVSFV